MKKSNKNNLKDKKIMKKNYKKEVKAIAETDNRVQMLRNKKN